MSYDMKLFDYSLLCKSRLNASVELNTFTNLRDQELQAIPKRVETRKEEVTRLLERENSLQLRYSNLTLERDTMLSKLSEQP